MEENTTPFLTSCPGNILGLIFKELTVKEALVLSSASKECCELIKNQYAIAGTLIEFRSSLPTYNRLLGLSSSPKVSDGIFSDILKPGFVVVGSCKGLVCITNLQRSFNICNPLTDKVRDLPEFPLPPNIGTLYKSVMGFGRSKVNEYYIVVLAVNNQQPTGAWKYTFKQGWVEIDGAPISIDYQLGQPGKYRTISIDYQLGQPGKYCTVNDSPYWLLQDQILSFSGEGFLTYNCPLLNGNNATGIFNVKHNLAGIWGSKTGYINLEGSEIKDVKSLISIPNKKHVLLLQNGGGVFVKKQGNMQSLLCNNEEMYVVDDVTSKGEEPRPIEVDGLQSIHNHLFALTDVDF